MKGLYNDLLVQRSAISRVRTLRRSNSSSKIYAPPHSRLARVLQRSQHSTPVSMQRNPNLAMALTENEEVQETLLSAPTESNLAAGEGDSPRLFLPSFLAVNPCCSLATYSSQPLNKHGTFSADRLQLVVYQHCVSYDQGQMYQMAHQSDPVLTTLLVPVEPCPYFCATCVLQCMLCKRITFCMCLLHRVTNMLTHSIGLKHAQCTGV